MVTDLKRRVGKLTSRRWRFARTFTTVMIRGHTAVALALLAGAAAIQCPDASWFAFEDKCYSAQARASHAECATICGGSRPHSTLRLHFCVIRHGAGIQGARRGGSAWIDAACDERVALGGVSGGTPPLDGDLHVFIICTRLRSTSSRSTFTPHLD